MGAAKRASERGPVEPYATLPVDFFNLAAVRALSAPALKVLLLLHVAYRPGPRVASGSKPPGRAWLALGETEAAAKDFGDAIAKGTRPTPEQVLEHRDALLSLGKKQDALRALDEGMTRVGPVVSLVLPAIDLELDLGRSDAALARLDALAGGANPNPTWIARRGEILEQAGRSADARAEYAKALALLDARPPGRRGKPLEDLRQRLVTALAKTDRRGDMP